MAKTEEQLRTTHPITRPEPQIDRRRSLGLMIAWAVLFPVALALEPAAASRGPQPWWSHVASFALLGGIMATFSGLARRQRWGVSASLLTSLLFVTAVFACPATGHHAFGLWWFGEFTAAAALVGLSATAYLRRT